MSYEERCVFMWTAPQCKMYIRLGLQASFEHFWYGICDHEDIVNQTNQVLLQGLNKVDDDSQ